MNTAQDVLARTLEVLDGRRGVEDVSAASSPSAPCAGMYARRVDTDPLAEDKVVPQGVVVWAEQVPDRETGELRWRFAYLALTQGRVERRMAFADDVWEFTPIGSMAPHVRNVITFLWRSEKSKRGPLSEGTKQLIRDLYVMVGRGAA